MAKHVVEVQCPEGYKPVYDESTKTIQMVPDNIRERVESVEDALSIAKLSKLNSSDPSVNALYELQVVLDVLNEGNKFDLIDGKVRYPWVWFYTRRKTPNNAKVIKEFCYKGKLYSLVGNDAYESGYTGIGYFCADDGRGHCGTSSSLTACKDRETAMYVSSQFGQLIFEACVLRYFDCNDFRWL